MAAEATSLLRSRTRRARASVLPKRASFIFSMIDIVPMRAMMFLLRSSFSSSSSSFSVSSTSSAGMSLASLRSTGAAASALGSGGGGSGTSSGLLSVSTSSCSPRSTPRKCRMRSIVAMPVRRFSPSASTSVSQRSRRT